MNSTVTFINKPQITALSPSVGFAGNAFTIQGHNLEDVETVYFIDSFGKSYQATFNTYTIVGESSDTVNITGTIPNIDTTLGEYVVRVQNSLGFDDHCCFSPYQATQTNVQNISGDDAKQVSDKITINAEISDTPTNTEGFEVLDLSYQPAKIGNKLIIQCEMSLQSNFWGSAVVALFKDNETSPSKVWNYALLGLNFGQIAKLSYVADIDNLNSQTWRVRIGRAAGTYPLIYLNRNSQSSTPYGGATSSWIAITEIDN